MKGKRKFLIMWALVSLLLAMLACGNEVTPTKVGEIAPTQAKTVTGTAPSQPQKPAATQTGGKYKIGDIVKAGDLTVVVLGWEKVQGDQFTKPEKGKEFIAVDLLLLNQGTKAKNISSLLQMYLKDNTGQKYEPDLEAQTVVGSAPEGEISPGERIRGKIGFQVPKEVGALTFVYDVDVFGTGKIFVDLGKEPKVVPPPPSLAGEKQTQVYNVGDSVKVGDLVLTVNNVTYPKGDEFNKPKEGYRFVVVDLTIENQGSTSVQISSLLQMSLKDATGQIYDVDLSAVEASGGTTPDGEVAPKEKVRGQVGFQAPKDAKDLVFVFDADVFGHGKVFVKLP